MKTSARSRIEPYASVFTPRNLAQYLAVQEWALKTDKPYVQVWLEPGGRERAPHIARVPLDANDVDYWETFERALATIRAACNFTLDELAEQVSAVHADLLYVRAPRTGVDGTISLRDAARLIDSVDDLVETAAIFTANPQSTGRGRKSERVSRLLERDLRFGHTKRGSFVITVAARLTDSSPSTDVSTPSGLSTPSNPAQNGPAAVALSEPAELDFTRRVMTTLSRSLSRTREQLEADPNEGSTSLSDARAAGVNAKFVQALKEISDAQGGGDVELSFDWSPTKRDPEGTASEIRFTPDAISRAPQLIEKLRQRSDAPVPVEIRGEVLELVRGDLHEGENKSGEIVVRSEVQGRTRKVRVALEGPDYRWAIFAFQRSAPINLIGHLEKVSNRWQLNPPVLMHKADLVRLQLLRTGNYLDPDGNPIDENGDPLDP